MSQWVVSEFAYFGKLPARADFVRYNASSESLSAIDTWIQVGIQTAKQRDAKGFEDAHSSPGVSHFFFCPESAQDSVLGVIKPSQDSSGRKYPFFVAGHLAHASAPVTRLPMLPMAHRAFFGFAESLVEDAIEGRCTAQQVTESLRTRDDFPGDGQQQADGYSDRLRQVGFDSLCTAIWGSFRDARKYRMFRNLSDVFLPFRNQESPRLEYGLVFPLPSGDLFDVAAGFWVEVCQRLLSSTPLVPSLILYTRPSESASKHSLYLSIAKLPATSFLQLLGLGQDDDTTFHLEGSDDAVGEIPLPDSLRQLLDSESASLWDVLQALA